MSEVYDRGRTAALIDEARKLTAAVKIEAREINSILEKAFDADEDEEPLGDETTTKGSRMFKWRFWR
jgi:hypothetical protein